jgi:hypothetical protein
MNARFNMKVSLSLMATVLLFLSVPGVHADDASLVQALRQAGHVIRVDAKGSPTHVVLKPRAFAAGQLDGIGKLTSLTDVNASGLSLDAASMAHLGGIASLQSLSLKDCRFDEAHLGALTKLKTLETLDLSGTSVSGHSLALFRTLPALKTLRLNDTKIDDDDEKALRALKQLTTLSLSNTAISPRVALQLKDALPSVDVRYGWKVALKEVESHMEIATPAGMLVFPEISVGNGFKDDLRIELCSKTRRSTICKFDDVFLRHEFSGADTVFNIGHYEFWIRDEGKVLQIGDDKFAFNVKKKTYVISRDGKTRVADWSAVRAADARSFVREDKKQDPDYEMSAVKVIQIGAYVSALEHQFHVVDLNGWVNWNEVGPKVSEGSHYGATLVFEGMPIPSRYRYGRAAGGIGPDWAARQDVGGNSRKNQTEDKRSVEKRRSARWLADNKVTFVSATDGFQINFNDQEVIDFIFEESNLVVHAKHLPSGAALAPQKVPVKGPTDRVVISGIMQNAFKQVGKKLERETKRSN